jgi:hypothetical protein
MMRSGSIIVLAALAAGVAPPARACDVCAVYTATELRERRTGFRLGVAEQITSFTTLQRDGEEVDNTAGERLLSSITQVIAGYGITPRFGVQLNLPLISRTFRRVENGRLTAGDETGVGDLSLIGQALAYSSVSETSVFRFSVLGGIKFPTGDASPLAEELPEVQASIGTAGTRRGAAIRPRHAAPVPHDDPPGGTSNAPLESGIHGHDLALGSGSYDGIVGAQLFWSWQRLFATAGGQYAIRTEGAFDYQFANDLTWLAGPGAFVLLAPTYTLGIQGIFSGETKGNDQQLDVKFDDTAITALYAGPAFLFTWGTSLDAEVAADLPVVRHNTGLQIVPDFRVRAAMAWRF